MRSRCDKGSANDVVRNDRGRAQRRLSARMRWPRTSSTWSSSPARLAGIPALGRVGRGVREQTRNALERIKLILEAAGTSLENVLTVTTHLTTRENPAAYNEEYGKYFPTNKPARTTIEVMLNSPELLVEITVTAGIPE
jgi:enamine deaminase RidA (YjgF/YER057c/UK114 family)